MMKIWKYILIPAAVFVVGLFLFFNLLNQDETSRMVQMAEASLPVVYMTHDGERINELHGYTGKTDAAATGDTVTPVGEDGLLSVSIDCFDNEITKVSFEVLSADSSEVLLSSEAKHLIVSDGVATADLVVSELPGQQEEYLLVLEVESSGGAARFYTRIAAENDDIGESIEFVRFFHEVTMSKTREKELTVYMETEAGADNGTLKTVTLKNTLSQVCWGDLKVSAVTEPSVSVLEIGEDYNVLTLSCIVSSTDEQANQEYYKVTEYYRVRRGEERMYVLEYERSVEEYYRGETGELPTEELNLGIRPADVEYMANETGTIVCFVQNGELWSYNMGSGVMTRIFSFISGDGTDVRETYDEHDIRVIRVGETGSVDFVVYGYMNRGEHEGKTGISVCHFDSAMTTVEEQVFLPSEQPYEVMCGELGQAMYITDSGVFCLTVGGQVYGIDTNAREYDVLISGMTEGNYVCSEDGRYMAWTEGDADEARQMNLIDLETGRTGEVQAPEGWCIRPLGFMDSDCVYGLVKESDIGSEDFFPMRSVIVVDFSDPELAVLKTYEDENVIVTGAELRDGNIYLERMSLEDGEYAEASEDVIYNRDMQDISPIHVAETFSDIKEAEVALELPRTIETEPELLTDIKWFLSEETELKASD